MKISKIIVAIAMVSIMTLTSCKDANTTTETTEEQGRERDADGNTGQEEFNVNATSESKEENKEANEQSNTATIVVKAHKALEYKFKISQYEKLEYEWTSDAPLHYDFHGDPEAKEEYPMGYFESYAIGNSDHAKGKVTMPYKGAHGWYWKNESDKDITITLTTKGTYDIIGLIQ